MHTEVLLATLTYLAQIFTALLVVLLLTAYTPSHLLGMATQSGWSMKSWLDSWWSGESLSVAARQRRARRRELASKRQDEDRKRVFGDAPCGLINTGNSCFINSTLQSLAACPKFLSYLDKVSERADEQQALYKEEIMDVPVTQALADLLMEINEPTSNRSLLPTLLIQAFGSGNRILNADQQDAQEFFQILSSALGNECDKSQPSPTSGLMDLLDLPPPSRLHTGLWRSRGKVVMEETKEKIVNEMNEELEERERPIVEGDRGIRSPFIGLLASRLACTTCDYTEAIRHFTFDNLSCNIPSTYQATLEECLQDYVRLEPLEDARCRRCSLTATLAWLEARSRKPGLPDKIRKEMESRASRVREALEINPAKELPGIKMEPGRSRLSTKQSLIAQAPPSLCLHLARSTFSPFGHIHKNNALVSFPPILDLAPFMTSGTLMTTARTSMSPPSPRPVRYRLTSVIVHYGSHEDGHYVAFRRGSQGGGTDETTGEEVWWRVSDSRVDQVSLPQVLRENPYILFYERLSESSSTTRVTEALSGAWKEKFRTGPSGFQSSTTAPSFSLANGHSTSLESELLQGGGKVAFLGVNGSGVAQNPPELASMGQRVPDPSEEDPPLV